MGAKVVYGHSQYRALLHSSALLQVVVNGGQCTALSGLDVHQVVDCTGKPADTRGLCWDLPDPRLSQ